MTGPGTAPTGLSSSAAWRAVLSAPERARRLDHHGRARARDQPVSAQEPRAMGREAGRHLAHDRSCGRQFASGVSSLPTGYNLSTPPAITAMVAASAASAARCAAASMPYAPPEITAAAGARRRRARCRPPRARHTTWPNANPRRRPSRSHDAFRYAVSANVERERLSRRPGPPSPAATRDPRG